MTSQKIRIKQVARKSAGFAFDKIRGLSSNFSLEQRALKRQRDCVEKRFYELNNAELDFNGTVLVEGTWDNPNFWLRYSLLRAAVGLSSGHEVGIIGPYNASKCQKSFTNIGISETALIKNSMGDIKKARKKARELLASTSTPQDILNWELPYNLPNDAILYDGILKRQRSAYVDLSDPNLEDYVTEALATFDAAANLLDHYKPSLVLLSHAANFFSASMAVIASQRSIPVILLFGQHNILRFAKITKPSDIYDFTDCPTTDDLDVLSPQKANALAEIGKTYLEKRFSGSTEDIGSVYAYKRRQTKVTHQSVAGTFGWDPEKPIIGVYASNWFDFPHTFGMQQYRDLLDWLNVTLECALSNTSVNWLFKAHPCDEHYGGITLKDLISIDEMEHVKLAPTDWNGSDLIQSLDALVTVYSTAGLEFAASGKPVLVADRGWYHNCGFVKWSQSRSEYTETLKTSEWWNDLDLDVTTKRAQIFAGCYFGFTSWQDGFLLEDDSKRDELYYSIPVMLDENPDAVMREITTLKAWFDSDARLYHTYKMTTE